MTKKIKRIFHLLIDWITRPTIDDKYNGYRNIRGNGNAYVYGTFHKSETHDRKQEEKL